jgi:putative ABC transport system permease protein
MLKNYFTIAWRNLQKNRAHSFINIAGLSIGMSVAMLIGLWIWDQLSFDKYHGNYDRIAEVMQQSTADGNVNTGATIPWPLDAEMRKTYGPDFKYIVMTSWNDPHVLSLGDKHVAYRGEFIGADGPDMLSLRMVKGSRDGLRGPAGMLISESVAKALFGDDDPMGEVMMMDNKATFKVSGVYEDLPQNTTFHDVAFMAPWDFYAGNPDWIGRGPSDWTDYSLMMYVQIADNANMEKISAKIGPALLHRLGPDQAKFKPELFLQPMSKWHLYSEFKNGVNTGGAIRYVWMFGSIGIFVLLLACINFMNLSTARSEKRAKEVGIRKAIGSVRRQLILQFYCESMLMAVAAFVFALGATWTVLPFFNELAGSKIGISWDRPLFWLMGLGFTLFTGIIAGSYPALYLSSFRPVKVLKGTFKAGRAAAIPRKTLVVLQFAVSVVLIIGTVVVFRQVEFAKNRPVGYNRNGLINIETTNSDLFDHFKAVRADLLRVGAIADVTGSTSPTTGIDNDRSDLSWKGKDPSMTAQFGQIGVSMDYGRTVGWQVVAGRDFSELLATDSSALVLNEAAVKYMGLRNPVGETIKVGRKDLKVIGVVRDMVMGSPYEPAKQTIYRLYNRYDDIIIRINPNKSAHEAIKQIEAVCKVYSPSVPFAYKFVDDEYASKFTTEERVGKLAGVFAGFAIFISCLGLFGMASFMAEQRVKEIGVRKVLGTSVFSLWGLLSREFVVLVVIALVIATPVARWLMAGWLEHYEYRSTMPWWLFVGTGVTAIVITLLTVSYQSIKAAVQNPAEALRSE